MWVDSSGLYSHNSSFIHHIAWDPLSWHVKKPQTLTSQRSQWMMQHSAQTEGWSMSTQKLWVCWCIKICKVHRAKSVLLPTCMYSFAFFFFFFTSKLHKTIFRMCYFALEQCEQCCNCLQDPYTWEVDRKIGNNRNNEQNKATMRLPQFH